MTTVNPVISLENLRHAWKDRHRHLSETQESIRRAAFGIIRSGDAATERRLVNCTGLSAAIVECELTTLEAQGLIVREAQGVVGIYGLSLVTTPHALSLDGQALFTWCALDAVGIPAGLVANATVQGQCFDCQQALRIVFRAGQVHTVSATQVCIWVTLPRQGPSAVGDT